MGTLYNGLPQVCRIQTHDLKHNYSDKPDHICPNKGPCGIMSSAFP